jgi:hypothetical protein
MTMGHLFPFLSLNLKIIYSLLLTLILFLISNFFRYFDILRTNGKGIKIQYHKTPKGVFICYRREDEPDFCGRIVDRLIKQFGKNSVFFDVDSIPVGIDFKLHITNIVKTCKYVLIIIGNKWISIGNSNSERRIDQNNDFVRIEIETALEQKKTIIPVLVKNTKFPSELDLPNSIKELVKFNSVTINGDPDFHKNVNSLISNLK